MALVIEDGSGKEGAESYATVAEYVAYHEKMGNDVSGQSEADQQAALRKAAQYMHRYSWKGERVYERQSLDWPRAWVEANDHPIRQDVVPERVKNAQAELAFRAINNGDLLADLDRNIQSAQLGPMSVTYASGSREQTQFAAVTNLVRPYIHTGTKLVR